MTRQLDSKEYQEAFGGERQSEALKHALEIRKFEIELYWKRAAYFWTFITAALAAYGLIQASKEVAQKEHLSVVTSVLGFVFSFAWQSVNRGSKQWQENWENHVAMLEDKVIGPLYKTVTKRPPVTSMGGWVKQTLTGPFDYSVSKINQIVSLFVTGVWVLLIWKALPPFTTKANIDWFLVGVVGLGAFTCLAMRRYGRTERGKHRLIAEQWTSEIVNDDSPAAPSDSTDSL